MNNPLKQQIISSLQVLLKDRYLAWLIGVFVVLSFSFLMYLLFSVKGSDLQLVIHYTSFGSTNFYRDKWYYLLTFPVFVILMVSMHVILTYRVLTTKGKDLAVAFMWLSIFMLFIGASLAYQVLKIASLS